MGDEKRRILIVDDEPNNLELMMRILRKDYRLAFATGGAEALEVTEKLSPDLILLDIMMPEMDGYETCRRLKADERTRGIPVIFVTAKGETEDETRGLDLGAVDYITKPVSPPIVKARIRNHLALRTALEEIERKNAALEERNRELVEAAKLKEDVERITRHDLKGPLNAVMNFPRIMLKDGRLSPEYVQYLEIIEQAGYQMLNMINLSLDMFKMERNIYSLTPVSIDALKMIDRIFLENRQFLEQKELVKVIQVNGERLNDPAEEDTVFFIFGEEMLCYSMLGNLMRNALEASPEKERITVDVREEADASVISIHNKGAVPRAIRFRFFDKYVTFGKESGTGLGTYSARLIAKTHGGSIRLDTSEAEGTRVTVRMPLERSA